MYSFLIALKIPLLSSLEFGVEALCFKKMSEVKHRCFISNLRV